MDHIIDQIRGTYDAGFEYAALVLALAAPDICANLALEPGANPSHQQKRYKTWFRENMEKREPISADDAWSLRCGVVHEGKFGNKDKKFDRVVFTLSGGHVVVNGLKVDGKAVLDRVLIINAKRFCTSMTEAVSLWYATVRDDPHVMMNLSRMVRYRPDGLSIEGDAISMNGMCIA